MTRRVSVRQEDESPTISCADRALAMEGDVTRRDFLNSTLLASGALPLHPVSPAQLLAQQENNSSSSASDDWTGYLS